jgi:hypothetical protein
VQWRRSSRRQRWMAAGQHRRSGDGFAAAWARDRFQQRERERSGI